MRSPTTILTGAGSGIGRAAAVLLSRLQHNLVLVGRRLDALEQTAAICSSLSLCISADIAEPASAEQIVASTLKRFGRVDNLINNAGFAPLVEIDETKPAIVEEVFQINALAPARLIARSWPHMRTQRSGCIINLSTLGTQDPFPGFFAYASAKSAVNLMARSCANEGREHNIRAFAIAPGAVDTDMLRGNFPASSVPADVCLSPESVAQMIVDCLVGLHDARNGETLFMSKQRGVW